MGRLVLIDGLCAVTLLGAAWYYCFLRYNRRIAAAALRWVEAACSGKGRIVDTRWLSLTRLQAELWFSSQWFENARVIVKLHPRPVPLRWLLSKWRKQSETLTFEADLDCAPSFGLQVFRHRWISHRHIGSGNHGEWTLSRPGPVVLTTRTQWTPELTPVVNTLMTSRGHTLISVRFRPESPHLAATVTLNTLTDQEAAAAFLVVVRELAAGASTHQQ